MWSSTMHKCTRPSARVCVRSALSMCCACASDLPSVRQIYEFNCYWFFHVLQFRSHDRLPGNGIAVRNIRIPPSARTHSERIYLSTTIIYRPGRAVRQPCNKYLCHMLCCRAIGHGQFIRRIGLQLRLNLIQLKSLLIYLYLRLLYGEYSKFRDRLCTCICIPTHTFNAI